MGLELNNLKAPVGSKKTRKRVGRGSGSRRGTYSGRGVKGQKSRSGSSARPGFEGGQTPLIKRIPKRGFRRKSHTIYSIINIRDLNKFKNKDEVTIERLKEESIIKGDRPVKILGDGELDRKLIVHANKFSKSAREKIEKAGGEVVEHV